MELSVSQSRLGKYLPRSQQVLGDAQFLGYFCCLLITAWGSPRPWMGACWPVALSTRDNPFCSPASPLPSPRPRPLPMCSWMLVPRFPNGGGGCLLCTPRTAAEHPTRPPKHHGPCCLSSSTALRAGSMSSISLLP